MVPFSLPNYSSARDHHAEVLRNLAPDLQAGRVVPVDSVRYSNAVGLIPKANSSEFRRITDLSRPHGSSVNESIPDRKFHFQTLNTAMALMTPGCFMAILDIRHAYRHIVIRPQDWDLQSFQVGNQCFQDRCLSFGLKIAPEVFTRFTQAILRIMRRLGYLNVMAYLDEFFVVGHQMRCWETIVCLIHLVRDLGFYNNWVKLILPTQNAKFLGFLFDAEKMEVRAPQDKISDALTLLLQAGSGIWLPLKTWERLVGKLNFIARAIYGARTFLRRLIDLVVRVKRQAIKGARVSKTAAKDIRWWLLFIKQWNGKALILDGTKILANQLTSDASNFAVGAVFQSSVIYLRLLPHQEKWHINVKELFAFLVAVRQWGHLFSRKHVKFVPRVGAQLDNTTALAWINKGTSPNKSAMIMLRELFWRSATQNFRVTCSHIPGIKNVVADAASRLMFHKIPAHYVVEEARSLTTLEIDWLKKLNTI